MYVIVNERDRKEISLATIVANNHFAEFGPGTHQLIRDDSLMK
jgi:hypothetical protein